MLTKTEHKTEHALTTDDIKALRKADDVSFHKLGTGSSHIRATKRTRNTGVFSGSEDSFREIAVGSMLHDYEQDSVNRCGECWSAFEMIHSAECCLAWQTIAGLLRAQDEIVLLWGHGAAGTIGIRDAGMVGDTLSLAVLRGEKTLCFRISTRVGHDNTARMIRRNG